MLGAIVEAVVECSDVAATARFNEAAFGLEVLAEDGDEVLLGVAGSPTGRLRLVPGAGEVAPDPSLWDVGPRLLGIYSRDLDRTVARIERAGGTSLPIASYQYGDSTMREVVALGPDGLYWTIPEVGAAHRPSPALAGDPGRLSGELHSAVLIPSDHDATLAMFTAAGMATAFDGVFRGEPFVSMTGMPADAALRLSFLTCADESPARLELMSFTGVPVEDRSSSGRGLRRLVFACDDPDATRAVLEAHGVVGTGDGILTGPDGLQLRLVDGAGTAS